MHTPPQVVSQSPTKKFSCYFKPGWQIGHPWMQYANRVMWSLARKEYMQI